MSVSDDQRFFRALEEDHRDLLRTVPKSDLHCHAGLGFRLEVLERWAGRTIAPPPQRMADLGEMNEWIVEELADLYSQRGCFGFALKASLAEAWNDGITLLEMSIDVSFMSLYGNDAGRLARMIAESHKVVAPEIDFRPELGIPRDMAPLKSIPLVEACLETGVFRSLDLYGAEDAQAPEVFKGLYRKARKSGIKCKVHSGEFGDAGSLLHDARVLEPDAIQHGIAAAGSKEAMRFLIDHGITLNICPTSNIRLSRVKDYAAHPIRTLFDEGVSVTLNSDDIMVFGQNVTDEYLHLHKAGLFTATELNAIRLNGLRQ